MDVMSEVTLGMAPSMIFMREYGGYSGTRAPVWVCADDTIVLEGVLVREGEESAQDSAVSAADERKADNATSTAAEMKVPKEGCSELRGSRSS